MTPLRDGWRVRAERLLTRFARHLPQRRHFQVLLAAVLALLLWLGYSIGVALTRPGNEDAVARLALWARDHHLNAFVTGAEKFQYNLHKPKTGGVPSGGIPSAAAGDAGNASAPDDSHSPAPEPVKLQATGAGLPNEGQWQTAVKANGDAAIRMAYVRPDSAHTSYVAALMWLDPKLLVGHLHPGSEDPGGSWQTPDKIDQKMLPTIAAAFNGGFRLNGASRGGYYSEGREALKLRPGAASVVIYKDGTMTVGAWGRDVHMGPNVASVRQNLDLLVDNGKVNPTCSDNNSPVWGYTLGNDSYVWRSALGVRADGTLVYVNAPALSVCTLGNLMKAAGAVRGMELDINPQWTVGFYFTQEGGKTVPHPTHPGQSQGGEHYLSTQSRDFFSFSVRK